MTPLRLRAFGALLTLALSALACSPGTTGGNDAATGGMFSCGTNMCNTATQYCENVTSLATGSTVNTYTCRPLPSGCTGSDYCMTCLAGMTGATGCGSSNTGDGLGYTVDLMR